MRRQCLCNYSHCHTVETNVPHCRFKCLCLSLFSFVVLVFSHMYVFFCVCTFRASDQRAFWVRTKICFFLHCIHLIRLALASHCNNVSTLKNYTWHTHALLLSPMWAASAQTCNWLIHLVAAMIIIIKKYLVSSSPCVLQQLVLFCYVVFPFSGADESLPELEPWLNFIRTRPPISVGSRFGYVVWSVVRGRFQTCSFGLDQAEKSTSAPNEVGVKGPLKTADHWLARESSLSNQSRLILCTLM